MDKLENLFILISDGRPTQKMIDGEVDGYIDLFLEQIFNRAQSSLSFLLFNEKSTIHEQRDFYITCEYKHYNEVLDDVEISIRRYSPFLKINPSFRRVQIVGDTKNAIHHKISIIFEITSEMKKSIKSILLQKELDKSLDINPSTLKKQFKL